MAEFIDPLNDPRFPGRPQRPDFWVIVAALNALGGRHQGWQGHPDDPAATKPLPPLDLFGPVSWQVPQSTAAARPRVSSP